MNRNVTFIDDLPFLEDVAKAEQQQQFGHGGLSMIPPSESSQIKRFIRNNEYNLPPEAGMNTRNQEIMEEKHLLQQQKMFEDQQRMMMEQENMEQQIIQEVEVGKKKKRKTRGWDDCDPNCVNVAEHTTTCPVCSKLYNNDKSLYFGLIIVLTVICLILLKKIVEQK
jgi:hypothetical protein